MTIRQTFALFTLLLAASAARADAPEQGPPMKAVRASGPISIDGKLDEPAWQNAMKVEQFWETNPGDNVTPKVKTTGYFAYDSGFVYAAFDMQDPDPSRISRQYGDHDQLSGNIDDFAGVIIDARHDRKTATEFFTTSRGTQFDAVLDDSSGNEDASPDFFWDSAARVTPTGWVLEMRIPFSSLRYDTRDVQEWGISFYRNYPRERRYQIFSHKMPRGGNCFVCYYSTLSGLEGLPSGQHVTTAPFLTAGMNGARTGALGSPLSYPPATGDGGVDVKWTPNASVAVDATVNPDFSQIESDAAAISANERFAIFFSEKRPFFLEGKDLFSTPIQAVYTRTITAPRWGVRSTGKFSDNAYTLLIAQDRGGGSVILPSPFGSSFANQDFSSLAGIGRLRHDTKSGIISILGTVRESEGGAHNRVIGPDFQWRNDHNTVTGQLLLSDTRTPNRPDVADEWNGQKLTSHAADLWWQWSTAKHDFFIEGKSFGDDFRAYNGFVPQVGYRSTYGEAGKTWRPKGFVSRLRIFGMAEYDSTQDGAMLYRLESFGFGGDAKYRSNFRFRYAYESVRAEDQIFQRHQLLYNVGFAVNRYVSNVGLSGWLGQDVDFANIRLGRGANTALSMTLRPTDHLEVRLSDTMRWLSVAPDTGGPRNRLFTAQVERIRAQYMFNNRMFLRAILQNQRTNNDRALYTFNVNQHTGNFSSQLLFAYKLNWQTVMFLGVGDLREAVATTGDLEPSSRQVFLKMSYAFQR